MIVYTESGSSYELDLERGTIARLAAHGGALRRDGEPILIRAMKDPVVGEPWRLLLDLRRDGIDTFRTTTPVVKIE